MRAPNTVYDGGKVARKVVPREEMLGPSSERADKVRRTEETVCKGVEADPDHFGQYPTWAAVQRSGRKETMKGFAHLPKQQEVIENDVAFKQRMPTESLYFAQHQGRRMS